MFKGPNGTRSGPSSHGSGDCFVPSTDVEVLRRISAVPEWYWRNMSDTYGAFGSAAFDTFQNYRVNGLPVTIDPQKYVNATEFNDVGSFEIAGESIGTLLLKTNEVAVFTLDLAQLANNMTYNAHYRVSSYVDCKPCPSRYQCSYRDDPKGKSPSYPPVDLQSLHFDDCLKREKTKVCVSNTSRTIAYDECVALKDMYASGFYPLNHPKTEVVKKKPVLTPVDKIAAKNFKDTFLMYEEPDLYKCTSSPYFCEAQDWKYLTWNRWCQDDTADPNDVYECSDVRKYGIWRKYAENACCSNEYYVKWRNVPVVGKKKDPKAVACTCQEHGLDQIAKNDHGNFIEEFRAAFGFEAQTKFREGKFIMNVKKQQEHGESPFDSFVPWTEFPSELTDPTLADDLVKPSIFTYDGTELTVVVPDNRDLVLPWNDVR